MKMTRDTKFKLSFDKFIKDVVGVLDYDLENLTKKKSESTHIYSFNIPEQTIIYGFIDRNGDTHTGNDIVNMDMSSDELLKTEFIPEKELFTRQFMETFDPYIDAETIPGHSHFKFAKSFVRLENCEVNDVSGVLEGKICVVYHKQHIPYYVEKDDGVYEKKYNVLLCRFNNTRNKLNNAYNDIDNLQDDLFLNERQIRKLKKMLYREKNINALSEQNLINKLYDVYKKSNIKEECPVCYDTIENEKLKIPRCAHYICESCHSRCDECPICRTSYEELIM